MSKNDDTALAYELLKPLVGEKSATQSGAASKVDAAGFVSALSDGVRTAASSPEQNIDDFVWDVWMDFFAIAGEIRYDSPAQDKLADILSHLRSSRVEGTAGDGVTLVVPRAGEVWKDLPSFGAVARDLWNFDIRNPDNSPEDIDIFNNQTAFLARLTNLVHHQSDADSPLDFSLYALWSLRDAFEQQQPHPAAATNAAIWICYSSDALRSLVSNGYVYDGNAGDPGPSHESEGWKGFGQKRWDVWKGGFEQALQQSEAKSDASEQHRGLLQRAAQLTL